MKGVRELLVGKKLEDPIIKHTLEKGDLLGLLMIRSPRDVAAEGT